MSWRPTSWYQRILLGVAGVVGAALLIGPASGESLLHGFVVVCILIASMALQRWVKSLWGYDAFDSFLLVLFVALAVALPVGAALLAARERYSRAVLCAVAGVGFAIMTVRVAQVRPHNPRRRRVLDVRA